MTQVGSASWVLKLYCFLLQLTGNFAPPAFWSRLQGSQTQCFHQQCVVSRARSVRTNTKVRMIDEGRVSWCRKHIVIDSTPSFTQLELRYIFFGTPERSSLIPCASMPQSCLCELAIKIQGFFKCMIARDDDDGPPRMFRRRLTMTKLCSHRDASAIVF